MKRIIRNNIGSLLLSSIFLLYVPGLYAEESVNTCLTCHEENDIMPGDFRADDVHLHAEISCVGCHGGDPTADDMDESMSAESGYIGIPSRMEMPAFCGKCHSRIEYMRVFQPRIPTDQVDQYYTSTHGKKLLEGSEIVAECASCHTAHGILPAKDTRSSVHAFNIPQTCNRCHGDADRMANTGHGSNQYKDYAVSVHGKALIEKSDAGAPACNDCHGNHGAAPPGTESVNHICGSCHLNNMEFFKTSIMGEGSESSESHSCDQCHGNHLIAKPSDEWLNVSASSICMECHSEGDEGHAAAVSMYSEISQSDSLYQLALLHLEDIQIKGMNDVDIQYVLKDAKQNLIQMRTMVHTFDPALIIEKSGEGKQLSQDAIALAGLEIAEFNKRRLGYGISTLTFVLLAFALYLKIRQIDTSKSEGSK